MWQAIIGFLGGPVIRGLLEAYNAKLKSDTDDKKVAAELAAQEVAAQTEEAKAIAQLKRDEIGHPWEPEKLAFYVTLVFYAKCVIWDKVFALGSTDPLAGDIANWAGMVMAFYFGKRTFENVARIIKR